MQTVSLKKAKKRLKACFRSLLLSLQEAELSDPGRI